MRYNVFIDTNIYVYAYFIDSKDVAKHESAQAFLKTLNNYTVHISTQVLNEFYSTSLRYGVDDETIQVKIRQLIKDTKLSVIRLKTIENCWKIKSKYRYSYYDSPILSSAMECNCSILYTEDMQDEQIIEEKLKIINPLKVT